MALGAIPGLAADLLQVRSTKRIGVTGLARAGKTALITSLAANLLALSAGRPALPAVVDRSGGGDCPYPQRLLRRPTFRGSK